MIVLVVVSAVLSLLFLILAILLVGNSCSTLGEQNPDSMGPTEVTIIFESWPCILLGAISASLALLHPAGRTFGAVLLVLHLALGLGSWLVLRRSEVLKEENHRRGLERRRREEAEMERAAAARFEAMPSCLRPLGGTANLALLHQELLAAYPDQRQRVLALFHWFGSGAGPWNTYTWGEGAAESLLLAYPTEALVGALSTSELTPAQIEGAARFFFGYTFAEGEPIWCYDECFD